MDDSQETWREIGFFTDDDEKSDWLSRRFYSGNEFDSSLKIGAL